MAIAKRICRSDIWELRDHRDNTSKDLIKGYSLKQISLMDGIDTRTVKTCGKYLPIRVDDGRSLCLYRKWELKKPYKVLWIRLDEIKYIFNKKTHKKLVVEL